MPPKRKAAPKKKAESPPPSESEPESEPDYSSEEEPESPKPKKTKAAAKPKAPPPKAKAAPAPSPKKAKAPPAQKKQAAKKGGKTDVAVETLASVPSPEKKSAPKVAPHVVIEHCKQCQSFKRTAMKLGDLLKKSIPDMDVSINPGPDKPRKGIFEVRDTEGNIFVSLQGLVRPFKKMKELNLEETADDVVSKLS